MLKVRRVCDHIRREIVQVGHDGDPQVHVLRLVRRKRRNRQCEDKDYRQQQRQQSASIVHSGFHFFLLLLYKFIKLCHNFFYNFRTRFFLVYHTGNLTTHYRTIVYIA